MKFAVHPCPICPIWILKKMFLWHQTTSYTLTNAIILAWGIQSKLHSSTNKPFSIFMTIVPWFPAPNRSLLCSDDVSYIGFYLSNIRRRKNESNRMRGNLPNEESVMRCFYIIWLHYLKKALTKWLSYMWSQARAETILALPNLVMVNKNCLLSILGYL